MTKYFNKMDFDEKKELSILLIGNRTYCNSDCIEFLPSEHTTVVINSYYYGYTLIQNTLRFCDQNSCFFIKKYSQWTKENINICSKCSQTFILIRGKIH